MKKLCNRKAKKIHPAAPSSSPFELLAFLPSALLTLAAALSPEEREVVFYLLSSGEASVALAPQTSLAWRKETHLVPPHRRPIHPPEIGCGCFGCYKNFWSRWDASPNRLVIHRILDAVEEVAELPPLSGGGRRRRHPRLPRDLICGMSAAAVASDFVVENGVPSDDDGGDGGSEGAYGQAEVGAGVDDDVRNPVTALVGFIRERVLGVWNY
ncbi:hypothetical protein HPP92_000206 [Vanilla planifolia]|uniref:Uncharacterized protein n=1 Tax=Vanilla planifolia TaxID=51239 RepID=A0A835RND9_VANPL|nr:hypothetical protein HPP92_000206 [Vanilla planifolia]